MVKKTKDISYYEAVGRRKEAVARVRLYIAGRDKNATVYGEKYKQGTILVNKTPIEKVFFSDFERKVISQPLSLANSVDRFIIAVHTAGGGQFGQVQAIAHGIARALEKTDKETLRPILKKAGLLTRDARTRERRKVGTGGKARRAKQSPKR